MNVNKVILAGNLTRDPQLKFLPSSTALCEFGIAINRKWKSADGQQREEVTFLDVAAFGKTAEVVNQHFTKGKAIYLEGRLKLDQWDDKQTGAKRSKVSVVMDSFQFVGAPKSADDQRQPTDEEYSQDKTPQRPRPPASRPAPAQQRPMEPEREPEGQFDESEIPF